MTEQTPETFDINGWLDGSAQPRNSAIVYGRADVVAKIQDTKRRLDLLNSVEDTEVNPERAKLTRQLGALHETFAASRLIVHVQAIDAETLDQHRITADEEVPETGAPGSREFRTSRRKNSRRFMSLVFADAIVSVQAGDQEPQDVHLAPEDVLALEKKIGPGQWEAINQAYAVVQQNALNPDADFLP